MEFSSGTTAVGIGELEKFLDGFSSKSLVVTFINISYFPVFERWHSCFRNCCQLRLLVVALDRDADRKLKDLGIESILFQINSFDKFLSTKEFDKEEKNHLSRLWATRWFVFQRIISKGIEVIHSDADAVWLKDPIPRIISESFDMAASIGRRWPRDAAQKWGFVLCMGFFVLRPTKASVQLVQQILDSMPISEQDDQVAINRILLDAGATWRRLANKDYRADIKRLNVSVTAIDGDFVSRESNGTPIVFHPYLRGNISQKLSQLDSGIHEIRSREGLRLSYYRRHPIPKMTDKSASFASGCRSFLDFKDSASHTRRLLFIHIPKAGGTSVQEMLPLTGRGHIRVGDIPDAGGAYTFTVCRNPYSRLVSAFHYLTDRLNLPKHDHIESEYVAQYANDFPGFVADLIGAVDIYRSIHLIPQDFFVCTESKVAVDEIIPLENLPDGIQSIIHRFGGNFRLEHINRSTHEDTNSYYDERTRAIVSRTYARDFEVFGYDPLLDAESAPRRRT
jgi:hypothetical protein